MHERPPSCYASGRVPPALRIGAAVLAVGLVAYAGWLLVGRDDASDTAAEPRRSDRKARESTSVRKAGADEVPRSSAGSREQPRGTAAPANAPAEAISAEDARVELTRLVDDLEDMVARGETVSQPRFIELYKRGTELAQTLAGATAKADEAEQKAFADLHNRFRVAIMKVQSRGG